MHYFIDGKTITNYLTILFLISTRCSTFEFLKLFHNASSNLRAGKTRIYIEHMYLCVKTCLWKVYTQVYLYIIMYTHIKTKHDI